MSTKISAKKGRCIWVSKTIFILPIVLYMALSFTGCNYLKGEKKDLSATICAQVNGQNIYLNDFELELERLNLDMESPQIESQEELKRLRKEILLLMIDREILLQEARARGLQIGDQELQIYLKELIKDYPPENSPLKEHLTDPTYENWRSLVREGMLIKDLTQQEFGSGLSVSDEESRAFFLTHKQEFDREREFRARQIVVESEMEAREILELLNEGSDFAALARERSLSPDREKGGDLGFFKQGVMPPEFDEVILQLKPGEISDVVQSDYGYHIFQLMEILEPREATWQESKDRIEKTILAKKRDRAFHDWLAQLREKAKIKIYPKAISKLGEIY